jgi:hypothetical protein
MDKNDAYLGNLNLKRRNVTVEYTQEQIEEYLKCSKSADYFIENYVKIINIDEGLVSFKLYDYQRKIVDLASKERFVICKMPRQCGKTTTIVGIILWHVLFNENYNVAVLAHKLQQSREILARVQLGYEHLPLWLQQGILEWNKGNVELENGSKILASATSSSAIRGGSFNLIYLDEFAFVPNNMQEQFFNSVYPTISSGQTSKIIITSTPNGMNMFYKLWKDSEEDRNSYKQIDVHWSDVPGRDEDWKRETIKNTSEEQFRQEFECEFLGSSNTLIDGNKLRMLTYITPTQSSEFICTYLNPEQGRLYTIVVDTSRALGYDYSAFIVFDATEMPYKVVAKYRNNRISSLLYPSIVYQFAKYYNNAFVLIETNDIGKQVADILHYEHEYENVFYTTSDPKMGQRISGGFGTVTQIGVKTSRTVKKIGCSNLKSLVENDKIILNDFDLLQEIYRFAAKGDSFEAEEGHDDLVMCCVLFAWLMEQPYVKELSNTDLRRTLYEQNESFIEESLTPFGIYSDGRDEYQENPIQAVSQNNDNWLVDELN